MGEDGTVIYLLNIKTREDVKIKPDGQEHPNVRNYVDVSTNVNDSLETNLSKDVHK